MEQVGAVHSLPCGNQVVGSHPAGRYNDDLEMVDQCIVCGPSGLQESHRIDDVDGEGVNFESFSKTKVEHT